MAKSLDFMSIDSTFFLGNSAFMGIYIISRPWCISLGPCDLWVMNVLNLKKWLPRRCLCFNTHTVYTVILVCLMLCTWPVSGSHEVNKVHAACRIAVTCSSFTIFQPIRLTAALLWIIIQPVVIVFLPMFRDSFSFLRPTLLIWYFCVTIVRIPSNTDRLYPATLTTTLPSIQPLATTLSADTTETFDLPHACLYKLHTGARGFPLYSWTLRMGLIGCPETSVRNYHYSLGNSQEEHSFQLLRRRILKLAYKAIFRESSCKLM